METIAEMLTLDNKISIVFLLCNDSSQAYELISNLKNCDNSTSNKLFHYFLSESLGRNNERYDDIVDALALTKNYRAARFLGFTRQQLKDRTLKENVRKKLYLIAELLTEQETLDLISDVSGTLQPKCRYLEENYLEWNRVGIISLGYNDSPVSIEKIIRNMQLNRDIPNTSCDNINTLARSTLGNIENLLPSNDTEYYNIVDENDVGFCIVINQKEFTRSPTYNNLLPEENLPPRPGSERDVEAVEEVFTTLGFRVRTHTNVPFEKLCTLLPEYAHAVPTHHSCIVLVVMSHGTEEVVYTCDSVPVSVESLEMAFQRNKCPQLVGKPKILIIQACQGRNLQRVMTDNIAKPESTLETLILGPERGDALIAWSTVKGFASFRDRYQGAWFIQNLCEELKSNARTRDLVDIVTRVNCLLRFKSCNGLSMVPSLTSSLCKKFKFYKK